jgi:hypothetical protein
MASIEMLSIDWILMAHIELLKSKSRKVVEHVLSERRCIVRAGWGVGKKDRREKPLILQVITKTSIDN